MNVEKLLKSIEISEIIGKIPIDVNSLCDHSAKVESGSVFFCRKGTDSDGKIYIKEAINNGAVMIVSEERIECGVCVVVVDNIRDAMVKFADCFYGSPQKELKVVGVVGTNGKTTTCHVLSAVLAARGLNVGVSGTLGTIYGGLMFDSGLTTLGTLDLYKLMRDMVDSGVEYLVMEVSAHAIDQNRVGGIYFEALIFTNCTEDHLDYFTDFENYAATKKKIFSDDICKYKIINSDDAVGREIIAKNLVNTITYGIDSPSDVFAVNVAESTRGINYVINLFDIIYELNIPLYGICNVYNTLAVCACAAALGVRIHTISAALKKIRPVSGRAEPIAEWRGASIFLDYAHTPDGLNRTLSSMKKICKGKLICLFGCGGNREKAKRPIMGEIAGIIADYSVITSDNPRYEDPDCIIGEIEVGIKRVNGNYTRITDRAEAIKFAVDKLKRGDVLVIAGKGAEKYQEINGIKRDFSDKNAVLEYIDTLGGNESL